MRYAMILIGLSLFLPLLAHGQVPPPPAPRVTDIRIDNVPLDQLDALLERGGIGKAARAAIIEHERKDRKPKGALGPAGRMVEDTIVGHEPMQGHEPIEGFAHAFGTGPWWPCVCPEGYGAVAWWKGAGTVRSHFLLFPSTDSGWSVPQVCPAWTVCTIVSTLRPGPGRSLSFQAYTSGLPLPIYISTRCQDPEFG